MMIRRILLIFSITGVIASFHGTRSLEIDSPSFLEDSLLLDQRTAISLFYGKLVKLLNSLTLRRHCSFVAQLSVRLGASISRTQKLVNKLANETSFNASQPGESRVCRYWKTKVSQFKKLLNDQGKTKKRKRPSKLVKFEIIKSELLSLYNNLPLPFQCEVLFEVGRLSDSRPPKTSENSVNSVTKMNVYEVVNIIKMSEKALTTEISIVKNADRCVKVLAGKDHRTTMIVVSVKVGNKYVEKWKRVFRPKMQWIMGKFAKDNGIKVDNLHNLTATHNLPYSAYFAHVLNSSHHEGRYEVRFHMHLLQTNSRAMEARLVLAALNSIPKTDLRKIFEVDDIKYWAVNHNIGAEVNFKSSYNLKMLFPKYLRRFFLSALQEHEKCLIVHFMTHYSNSSNEKVAEFLKRKRINLKFPCSVVNGVIVVLSPKRNRGNFLLPRKTESPTGLGTPQTQGAKPLWKDGVGGRRKRPITLKVSNVNKRVVNYQRKATMVEIIMLVLLGSLAVVIIIFFSTCTLFIVRKRRFKKQLQLSAYLREQCNDQGSGALASCSDVRSIRQDSAEVEFLQVKDFLQQSTKAATKVPRPCNERQRSTPGKLINIKLEPLRFSTDDEESRCDEEETGSFSPVRRHSSSSSSIYRGGHRMVPAVRYSKSLALKLASAENEKTTLEQVPERRTSSLVDDDDISVESGAAKSSEECRQAKEPCVSEQQPHVLRTRSSKPRSHANPRSPCKNTSSFANSAPHAVEGVKIKALTHRPKSRKKHWVRDDYRTKREASGAGLDKKAETSPRKGSVNGATNYTGSRTKPGAYIVAADCLEPTYREKLTNASSPDSVVISTESLNECETSGNQGDVVVVVVDPSRPSPPVDETGDVS